ncbi:MAG: hypothetical protein HXX11_14640 [Desulfuromonadales bacterium]|nr:hypothetical protein [Desulfuromonadales bacterium]
MQILLMVWNGINGHVEGAVLLKGLFIMALASMFWMVCELVKHLVNVLGKLSVDGFKYLAIIIRGWPKQVDEGENMGGPSHRAPIDKGTF